MLCGLEFTPETTARKSQGVPEMSKNKGRGELLIAWTALAPVTDLLRNGSMLHTCRILKRMKWDDKTKKALSKGPQGVFGCIQHRDKTQATSWTATHAQKTICDVT